MKTGSRIIRYILIATLMLSIQSCLKDEIEDILSETTKTEQGIYSKFEFKTVQEYNVTISLLYTEHQPADGVYVELYMYNPLNSAGILIADRQGDKVFTGISDSNGIIQCKINPPNYSDSLFVLTYHPGIPTLTPTSLSDEDLVITIGGQSSRGIPDAKSNLKSALIPTPTLVNGFYTLGSWNHYGVPDYLEPENDLITNTFLDDVVASLPERDPLPQSHPQYLANDDDASLILIEEGEVWVTFVHEGSGWHNTLGYYTFQTVNPPINIDEISDHTIIFPDVSAYRNGLSSGNKVQLFYLDPLTNEYSNLFPAGVSIGWFLIAQGWSSNSCMITNGKYTHYSNLPLNAEATDELKKHNALLYDENRELLLLGFEDIRRDNSGCDHDFNDAVFYTTVNPVSAIDHSVYKPIDRPLDSDNDGITDVFDEYPEDPVRAFNNYYPALDKFGTLVYEDLWPYKGDYDFNDLVIDYNFNQVTNAQNEVTDIRSKIVVRAIGASYHNAFGVSLNTNPNNVSSVSGQLNTKGYISTAANGTEIGQSNAVVIFFDDAYNVLPYTETGLCVNTYSEDPYLTPDTMQVDIEFTSPIAFAFIGAPPYNPFIIIDRVRGKEVHLPNLPPTDLANEDFLGTGDDDSNIGTSEYYVSDNYLPWAINLPARFDYPAEKQDITKTHLMFDGWTSSRGNNYKKWYMDKPNHRNISRLYSK